MIKRGIVSGVLLTLAFFLALPPHRVVCAQEVTFQASPEKSQIGFAAKTAFFEFSGKAEAFSLVIVSPDPETLKESSLRVTIDAATLDTGNSQRDSEMRNMVLEVGKYPTIEFHSSHMLGLPEDYNRGQTARLKIPGRLTLHGVTRDLTLPLEVTYTGDKLTARGEVSIRLSDFRIPRPRLFFFITVKDEVRILFSIESTRSE